MALIPVDVALGAVNSIRGLLGANQADNERRRQLAEAARQRRLAIDQLAQDSNRAFQDYQRRLQAGEFDATKTLDLIGRMSSENLRTGLGNQLTSLRNLGYKAGDTPIEMGTKAMTSDALLREQAQRLQAQQQFEDRQQQALGYVDQARAREAQARLGLGGQMMSEGLSMPGNNVTNTIQGLASQYQQMLEKQKKEQEAKQQKEAKTQVTPSTVQPTRMENPYMTSMDWQNNVSRVNEIPLSGIVNSLRYLGR